MGVLPGRAHDLGKTRGQSRAQPTALIVPGGTMLMFDHIISSVSACRKSKLLSVHNQNKKQDDAIYEYAGDRGWGVKRVRYDIS